jgi:hypothetical protein
MVRCQPGQAHPSVFSGWTSLLGAPGGGADKYAITVGERILEILHVQDMAYELEDPSYTQGNHSADMLMAYLPKERILINADLYSPPAEGAPMPAPTAGMRTPYQNMRKQKLDVAQHVPIHGRVGTNDEFLKILSQAVAQSD